MVWVKVDDGLAEDPRFDEAGPLALALHVAALCWCSRQLTDGQIPTRRVRRLLDLHGLAEPDDVAALLVDAGVWDRTADGFEIVGYLDDQPSRAHVMEVRAKRAAAGQAGGHASGTTRRRKSEATLKQSASQSAEQVATTALEPPSPTHPTPPTSHGRDPVAAAGGGLEGVILEGVPDRCRPDRQGITTVCGRLAVSGWTADHLATWLAAQRWPADARPGLVVHRLGALTAADRPKPARPRRAASGPTCACGALLAGDDGSCTRDPDHDQQVPA